MEQPTDSRWERPDAPLGTLVYRAGLLSKEKLESALVEGRRTGKRLGEVLLQKGWIDEKDLARLVAGQKGVAFVSLRGRGFDPEVARRLDERIARGNDAVAVEDAGDHIVVAVADPTDEEAVAEVKNSLGREIELVVATPSEIHEVLDEVFRPASDAPLTSDFALRLAEPVPVAPPVTEPDPEPEPEPEPEPVLVVEPPVASEPVVVDVPAAEDPAPVETPTAQPDFLAPVAIELPKLHPTPQPEEEPTPEPETRIEVVGLNPDPEPPAVEPAAEGQNDAELGIAAPSEPDDRAQRGRPCEPRVPHDAAGARGRRRAGARARAGGRGCARARARARGRSAARRRGRSGSRRRRGRDRDAAPDRGRARLADRAEPRRRRGARRRSLRHRGRGQRGRAGARRRHGQGRRVAAGRPQVHPARADHLRRSAGARALRRQRRPRQLGRRRPSSRPA